MKDLQIFVCAHKFDSCTRTEYPYVPIQGGRALHPDVELGYITDDTGDNISQKNASFCEWTVHYWVWKNVKDIKYVGLCHYRRYFDLSVKQIENIMHHHDVIVVKQDNNKMLSRKERLDDLIRMTCMEDAYLFLNTFIDVHPNYKSDLIDYYYNSRDSVPYSMFISDKKTYDKICEFIFPVLFQMDKLRKKNGYSRPDRAIGYFGEFSLGLAIKCLGLSTYRAPLSFIGEKQFKKKRLKMVAREIKYYIERTAYLFIDMCHSTPREIKCPDAVRVGLKNDGIILSNLK